jgi:hypothetical protein
MTMHHAKATGSPTLHTIGFDVSTDPERGTIVLIDDHPFALQARGSYGGFGPDELFAADLPLMPRPAPHRVAIAPCECGTAGCGNIALLVGTAGPDEELVVWSDFRDLGCAVSSPSEIEPDLHLDDRPRLPQEDLLFDRVQYEAAVLAAGADRWWETPADVTARLLRGMLATDAAVLRSSGFELSWVAPSWNVPGAWTVALMVPHPHRTAAQHRADALQDRLDDPMPPGRGTRIRSVPLRLRPWERAPRQVIAQLTTSQDSSVAEAADLYRQLTAVPITDWEQRFPRSDPHRG